MENIAATTVTVGVSDELQETLYLFTKALAIHSEAIGMQSCAEEIEEIATKIKEL